MFKSEVIVTRRDGTTETYPITFGGDAMPALADGEGCRSDPIPIKIQPGNTIFTQVCARVRRPDHEKLNDDQPGGDTSKQ